MLPSNKDVLFTRQRHLADRAGPHWDIRIVHGEVAPSWATRKDLPEAGKSIMVYETTVHSAWYALQSHIKIAPGNYGAGSTTLDFVKKSRIGPNATPDQFVVHIQNGDRLLFKRMSEKYGKNNPWLLKNLGPEKNKYLEKISSYFIRF